MRQGSRERAACDREFRTGWHCHRDGDMFFARLLLTLKESWRRAAAQAADALGVDPRLMIESFAWQT